MKFVLFYKSLGSAYNFSQAHFLKGVTEQLISLGHEVMVYGANSSTGEVEQGVFYISNKQEEASDSEVFDGVDIVIVHHDNRPEVFENILAFRKKYHFKVLIHDSSSQGVDLLDNKIRSFVESSDGVMASTGYLISRYFKDSSQKNIFLWPNAVDSKMFYPNHYAVPVLDVFALSNWDQGAKKHDMVRYFLEPAKTLKLSGTVVGADYPTDLVQQYPELNFEGYVPNVFIPSLIYNHKVFVHFPSKETPENQLGKPSPGIFEAMACGIPVVSAPWDDSDFLFTEGLDYVQVASEEQMEKKLKDLLYDRQMAMEIARNGMRVVNKKHTCRHRANQLLEFCKSIGAFKQGGKQEAA